ncbi:MAG: hypothetical protein DCF25_19945 [Leptolyngbya foveolarum]|uniref:Uncharacterized protein n=1 Tax=Leptolyngbya foveolarum TaxID=47253 RepID=A0A2W4TPQ3_9CYAN|nr:MAG: hypothetical protein DCF25_19945 [Leptolyngbya foveolarum]
MLELDAKLGWAFFIEICIFVQAKNFSPKKVEVVIAINLGVVFVNGHYIHDLPFAISAMKFSILILGAPALSTGNRIKFGAIAKLALADI